MHRADDVGAGDVENLVAALVTLEVVEGDVVGLKHRPHGPVGDHDTLGQDFTERRCACHGTRVLGTAQALSFMMLIEL
ncbi:hypothetical protein GCM10010517_69510 [Streptosporangium fragile]|uniref:Uncharacterized protein n=1 Tax=Streptosporangium fragile TaxID=46186 RepID=A0ABP6IPP4_9ACTN